MLNEPIRLFGTKEVALFDRRTGKPFGLSKWIDQQNIDATRDTIKLMTGAYGAPVKAISGDGEHSLSITFSHFDSWMCYPLFGVDPTEFASSANPTVGPKENISGVSLNGTTVAASTTNAANAKFGRYIVIATATAKVNIYGLSSVDFNRGTKVDFIDNSLKLLATDITVTTGGVEVPSLGIKLTAGATPAYVTGDSFIFSVRPAISEGYLMKINSLKSAPEVGLVFTSEEDNGLMNIITYPRVVAQGPTLNFARKDFNKPEVTFNVLSDESGNTFEVETVLAA